MPSFHTQKEVRHSAQKMFALVADIERYPEFLPMCESLTVRSRRERDGNSLLVADMKVGYKMISETFTTQVYLRPRAARIDVQYLDGPFKHLENRWQFLPASGAVAGGAAEGAGAGGELPAPDKENILAAGNGEKSSLVDFYIDYAFRNPLLSALMGTMFETAFNKFTDAFETRADAIYGA